MMKTTPEGDVYYPVNENCPFYDPEYCQGENWGCGDCDIGEALVEGLGLDAINEALKQRAEEMGTEYVPYIPEGISEEAYRQSQKDAEEREKKRSRHKNITLAIYIALFAIVVTVFCVFIIPLGE